MNEVTQLPPPVATHRNGAPTLVATPGGDGAVALPAPPEPAGVLDRLDALIGRVQAAQRQYATYAQEQVDAIFRAAALAANAQRIPLAKLAAEETGMGLVEDKVIKNHFAAEYTYNKYRDTATCGVLEHDATFGIRRIAEPVGVIAGVVPVTNPTSTTVFKALLSLKTRNGILFSPHPRARRATAEAARVVLEAAVAAGAPPDLIGWIGAPTVETSQHLMAHPAVDLILATGGPGMVHAAYSSGTPALGVGAGNTPAVIDETADVALAVNSVLLSKTFDHGMICASEQAVVVVEPAVEAVRAEFRRRGAYLLSAEEQAALAPVIAPDGKLNGAIVGQPAAKIAAMAGLDVPANTKVLIAEVTEVGPAEPFSIEKLSPVLALYRAPDFEAATATAQALVAFAGHGHTAVLYTAPTNAARIEAYGARLQACRILVNQPASQGAIGDLYNFRLEPSLTLGCGSWGGNSVAENVGVRHLLNVKTVAERRENMLWFRVPEKVYFKPGSLPMALAEVAGKRRAMIVTDEPLRRLGFAERVSGVLEPLGVQTQVFADVQPDPDFACITRGVEQMRAFEPDVIVAIGGGSPMDAAKIMWLLYEHPGLRFEDLAMRFMDIRKRVFDFPKLGAKATFVAVPTTSGTGSEVTPFAVVTDETTGIKYPIADYELTPDVAIADAHLVLDMPKALTAHGGLDALTHALEALVAVTATDFTAPYALESTRMLLDYLPAAYRDGAADPVAREKVHHASTMAGMAFANGFLGICHSLAHKIGAAFGIPHGLANALMISHVIRYNATDVPVKQATFPQYACPQAVERYARLADYLGLGGTDPADKVERLVAAVEDLKRALDVPRSIQELGIDEDAFLAQLDDLAERAFDDQCTGCNPRYPLISDLKQLYLQAYYGA